MEAALIALAVFNATNQVLQTMRQNAETQQAANGEIATKRAAGITQIKQTAIQTLIATGQTTATAIRLGAGTQNIIQMLHARIQAIL